MQPDFINVLQGHSLDTRLSLSPTTQSSCMQKCLTKSSALLARTTCLLLQQTHTGLLYLFIQMFKFSFPLQNIHKLQGRDLSRLTVFHLLGLLQQSIRYLAVFSKVLPNGSIMRIFILQCNCSYAWLLSKPPEKTSPQKTSNKIQQTDGTKSS